MALVCDISNQIPSKTEEDLEDGEIEDDDEEEVPAEAPAPPNAETVVPATNVPPPVLPPQAKNADRKEGRDRRRHEDKLNRKHMTEAEKSILHLRKREKMQREKWEKYRKEVQPPPNDPLDDDFAKNIEKTLASILSKKEKMAAMNADDKEPRDEKDEEKRSNRKRKKHNKDRQKNKQRRTDSPNPENMDENEMGGSPSKMDDGRRDRSLSHSDNSYSSEDYSSDRSRGEERNRRREKKANRKNHNRDRNKHRDRDRRNETQVKDSPGVCLAHLHGTCVEPNCPHSHEAAPPLKLELCKFYLMDCCAKGENCSYMHSEFPCKFYHTGLPCPHAEKCKFSHGKPLSDGLKQVLFKHIETAPRDILGGFPRMSREETLNMINVTQLKLVEQYNSPSVDDGSKNSIPSLFDISVPVPIELLKGDPKGQDKQEKSRNRRSRWQDAEPDQKSNAFPMKPFSFGQDQDMRINSNGDIDMRTMPPTLQPQPPILANADVTPFSRVDPLVNSDTKDVDIRPTNLLPFNTQDVDIRQPPQAAFATKDVDIRQIPPAFSDKKTFDCTSEEENGLQIDTGEDDEKKNISSIPENLPKTQRALFMRIQAHQKDVKTDTVQDNFEIDENINWYSDDESDDENRLTIKVDNEEKDEAEKTETSESNAASPPSIRPIDVVEKLGDLSKIDISAEVTKLLTSINQNRSILTPKESAGTAATRDPRTAESKPAEVAPAPKAANDPRTATADPRLSVDPRQRSRGGSTDSQKTEKISIYEQGSIFVDNEGGDDLRGSGDLDVRGSARSDVDLRNLALPFKAIQNYTPATEIDASFSSHPPISWKVYIVEIPRPDYTGLKLSAVDAEKSGDPRLKKIFRLSTDEKDSPMSPKESSSSKPARIDPRLRKQEEKPVMDQMNFNQQVNTLQSSMFYQGLTSNQKLHLNQELATLNDQNNSHDPVLNSILSNLNLIPTSTWENNPSIGAALAILANVAKLNPRMNQANSNMMPPQNQIMPPQNPNMLQNQGLLGAAPGIPNIPPDFPINFDPRNGGLLGNAPPQFGGNFPPDNFQPNFNDDFYPNDQQGFMNEGNRPHPNPIRGFNRDRRRGRNNFNRNNRSFRNNRNNNRSNRTHSPP